MEELEVFARYGDLAAQFLLCWDCQVVVGREHAYVVAVAEGVFHFRVVLVGAKHDADCRIVHVGADFGVVVVDIQLHLSDIGIASLAHFKVDDDVAFGDDVVKDEVGVKMCAVDGDASLAADECEPASEFEQELAHVRDDSGFEVFLLQCRVVFHAEKFQHKWVVDEFERIELFGLCRAVFLYQLLDFRFVLVVGEQPLVILCADLPFKLPHAPRSFGSLLGIILAGFGVAHTHQKPVMRPTQLVTQCVTFLEREVESPHILQVSCGEALAEVGCEAFGEFADKSVAVGGAFFAALCFHDQFAHMPIGLHHGSVDSAVCMATRIGEDLLYLCVKAARHRFRYIIHGLWHFKCLAGTKLAIFSDI